MKKAMTTRHRLNLLLLVGACIVYVVLQLTAPRSASTNSYQLSAALRVILSLTIVGLLLTIWIAGFTAWLRLDRYSQRLPKGPNREAFGQMAQGMWFLAAGLIISSLIGATNSFYRSNIGLTAIMTQLNYYIIVLFPFLGFMKLRMGSRHLAVSAQAAMTVRAKFVTVGPPVALLAVFYVYLAATNTEPSAQTLSSGTVGTLVLWLMVGLTIGSWVLGLLAALNVERATYRSEGATHTRPLVGLYNGILTTTGGFIILDALLSLGATRLQTLPVGALLLLLYGFIGVVGLGFWIVAMSAQKLTVPVAKAQV
jgi:hypothetical protein